MQETRICLIRHGETDWNAERRIQGQRDLPLNATGRAQARALARRLSRERFDAIHCSDLERAQETARPFAKALGLRLALDPALRERNFGCGEGRTPEEIEAEYPAVAQAMAARCPDYVIPGGESLRQQRNRVFACLARLAREYVGGSLAVVTHGGALDLVYRRAHGLSMEQPGDFPLPNASINWLLIDGEDWRLESWGDTAHLENIS